MNLRTRTRTLLGIGAMVVVVATIVALRHADWLAWLADELDARSITTKRWNNHVLAATGQPLPGTPKLADLDQRLAAANAKRGAPVFVRIFKREFELELWLKVADQFQLFATYPVCTWSGRLGPKLNAGDRQAPEGVYLVSKSQLNPQSRWHRSFNLGFPNTFDKAHGRTGSFLMVHGGCSSAGCFAMTNAVIDEIWTLVEAALKAGQPRFQVQVLPFRMSEDNLKRYADRADADFWQQLKPASDLFEATHLPPTVHVCNGRYKFTAGGKVNDAPTSPDAACAGVVKGKPRSVQL